MVGVAKWAFISVERKKASSRFGEGRKEKGERRKVSEAIDRPFHFNGADGQGLSFRAGVSERRLMIGNKNSLIKNVLGLR